MSDVDERVLTDLAAYIGEARWFGGKGRDMEVTGVRRLGWIDPQPGPDAPHARVELVTVSFPSATGSAEQAQTELYQLPLAYYPTAQERIAHALIGTWEDAELGEVHVYDAVHDRYALQQWLSAFARRQRTDDLEFHLLEGRELDLEAHSSLFSGEQSNSSVRFGEDALMKVFRKVTPGRNPDIEIHEALTRAESDHVAALYGWLEVPGEGPGSEPLQLAMLQQLLRTASDGWDLALASVRDLFAEADLHADEVGGDFAGEAARLGMATAEVHEALAHEFPTETWGAEQLRALSADMLRRLDDAVATVEALESCREPLAEIFRAVAEIDEPVQVQRIHADYHLGQTLRTSRGWKIVDFEGEPAKPLHERVRPDSRWRDVAGMLRSFDYAARVVEADIEEPSPQIAYRAHEWSERNRNAFLAGYLGDGEGTTDEAAARLEPVERTLLRAYEADKAVYEAVYEARNRPTWLGIPLAGIARLTSGSESDDHSQEDSDR
ncbi:maltokinase N-terminal cap-like domain-containing protein [Nocardioides pakistanensis]